MLTREENELLTHVGPGTAMGEMLREYWTPALRAQKLEPDGAPARVRLLGENFVAFRATDGRVGFFDEGCPHRCTSLALARNEDNALTCIFHGWKIDVSGKVVDVPSEPPERRAEFAAKVRVRHYPVREAGGIVWVYLGRREQPPAFFNFEFNSLPPSHLLIRRAQMHCNWFQGLEGVLDSAHLSVLHSGWVQEARKEGRGPKAGQENLMPATANSGPVFELSPRAYGFREGALRTLSDGTIYARIRELVLPYFSFIPFAAEVNCLMICAVPVDDEWTAQWYVTYNPRQPITPEYREGMMRDTSGDFDNFCSDMGGWDNMWHQDRRKMKEGHWTGLRSVNFEDFIVQESMGPIVDRSREYLGQSDSVIIRTRRMLLEAARAFAAGRPAPGQEQAVDYSSIRALALRYSAERNWLEIDPRDPPEPLPGGLLAPG
jgi:phthalate 4,5-dioxygenase oxygenase subunit